MTNRKSGFSLKNWESLELMPKRCDIFVEMPFSTTETYLYSSNLPVNLSVN